jgi:hypothetical protein
MFVTTQNDRGTIAVDEVEADKAVATERNNVLIIKCWTGIAALCGFAPVEVVD